MLGRLDCLDLEGTERKAYDFAIGRLDADEPRHFKFSGSANVELYAHTDNEHFVTQDYYIRDWGDSKPLVELDFESWMGYWLYGFGQFRLGPSVYGTTVDSPYTAFDSHWMADPDNPVYKGDTSEYAGIVGAFNYGAAAWGTNTILTGLPDINLDVSMPYRAFLAAGGDHFSIAIGRDRLSWGAGESGNLLVGSQVDYHSGVRAAFFNKSLKYVYNVTSFSHPSEYYNQNGKLYEGDGTGYAPLATYFNPAGRGSIGGLLFFVAHRIEGRLFGDKVGFALNEAIMTQSEDGVLSPDFFLPLMLLHDLDRANNSNSILTLEVDYSPWKWFNVYGQMAVDEFHIPGVEGAPGSSTNTEPDDAFGFLAGVKGALPLWQGMLNVSAEYAYTDPYLYLRYNQRSDPDNNDTTEMAYGTYGLNFVGANRYRSLANGAIAYWEEFIGYRWGNDAQVFNLNANFRVFGEWSAGVNFLILNHGTFDKWTLYQEVTNAEGVNPIQSTPTTSGRSNNADSEAENRNAALHLYALSLSGAWNLPWVKNLSVYGQTDFVWVVNPGNYAENAPVFDLQFMLGASYVF
jgi:hypothetical protein